MEPMLEVVSEVFSFPVLPPTPSGEADWGDLVRRYQGVVRGRVWRLLEALGHAPRELVEEVLQDVYCRLFEDALPRWRGRTVPELIAYLGVVADRTVLDFHRRSQALQRCGFREIPMGRRRIEGIPDPRDPERDLLHAESQVVVLRTCRQGAPQGKAGWRRNVWVARLALLEGWTNREIALAANGRLSPAHVASLLHRLRRRLQRQGP
ncbi:MAG TPA: hypothetical protein DD490_07415, partial [Acidobacteria bacterium]|nr:hypothetical protein [Acidobacteriota bacterium]